jgi:hypothetical protein
MILLIGSEGNMGKRYKAIFDHIKNDYVIYDGYYFEGYESYDVKTKKEPFLEIAKRADKFLIATPTETHCQLISELAVFEKPILCEKPITTNIEQFRVFMDFCKRRSVNLTMVNQYAYASMQRQERAGMESMYNYFRHGTDGLAWDCINILGLAKSKVNLYEASPVWRCEINGKILSLGDIDGSYIRMILDWMRHHKENIIYTEQAHEKAHLFHHRGADEYNAGIDRNTGPQHVYQAAG